jgi:chromosome segregation ATPase
MSEIDPYEREAAKAAIHTLERELARATAERDELVAKYRMHYDEAERLTREINEARKQRDTLAEALRGIMKITIPDQNMPYCNDDRIYGIAKEALTAVKGGKP